jgi:hypothetical protein
VAVQVLDVGGHVGEADLFEELGDPLRSVVELVVAHRADVEAHPVDRRDRGAVVEVARDEGRGADHVPRVDPDRAAGSLRRRLVELGREVGGAPEVVLRLEVAV